MKPSKRAAGVAVIAVMAMSAIPATPALADNVRRQQWHLEYLRTAQANAITKGAGIVVAVIDSGVEPHRDFKENLLEGRDAVPDGDGVGHVDQLGHGTEMAGLIAGYGTGAQDGALGIAPQAKILPIKIIGKVDGGVAQDLAFGMTWAIDNGANVINVSGGVQRSIYVDDAVRAATKADVVVVAAAGNRSGEFAPGINDGVLAVGAIDRNQRRANFSTRGKHLQLCAPGVDIVTTKPKDKYVSSSGTSPATAIVAGAAALVRAKFPDLSAPEVIHRLTYTATDIGKKGRDDECGFGALNLVKALTADVPRLEVSAGPANTPSASSKPTDSVSQPVVTPPPTGTAAPQPQPASSNTGLVVGGTIGVVVLLGGLITAIIGRQRRGA